MIIYKSKKNPELSAKLVSTEEKYGTVILEYTSGSDVGKTISITTSTLKRWWKRIEDPESPLESLNIDIDKVNEPYPEPKVQKYIPKPKSVIEYEEKKNKSYNLNLPGFESIVEDLGEHCVKVNNNSSYVKFADKSTLWRKSGRIDVYASQDLWELLTEAGLESRANKDKDRPFAFKIDTQDKYDIVSSVIKDKI